MKPSNDMTNMSGLQVSVLKEYLNNTGSLWEIKIKYQKT